MSKLKQTKLNWLQANLPEGLVVNAAWLQRHGYSSGLRAKYVAHGWLDQVARSVYRRPPAALTDTGEREQLRWQHVVISLQTLLGCPLTVGGRTALELQGFAHYLNAAGPREVHLYSYGKPPGWVSKLKLNIHVVFHNAEKLLKGDRAILRGLSAQSANLHTTRDTKAYSVHGSFVRQPWGHWEWPLILSSAERAILELLDEVPQHETFHQADMLMEGLRNLSPRRLHALLVQCSSVKAKRLFFFFAERHDHAWLKGLDRKGIDLGQGKRMLVRGGKLDTKYNITVPENLDASG